MCSLCDSLVFSLCRDSLFVEAIIFWINVDRRREVVLTWLRDLRDVGAGDDCVVWWKRGSRTDRVAAEANIDRCISEEWGGKRYRNSGLVDSVVEALGEMENMGY